MFCRPLNPSLSAQQGYSVMESPIKGNWGSRGGLVLTPATPPVVGSWSYISHESSHCSTLNNAVIMDEDEIETIPTDEKKKVHYDHYEDHVEVTTSSHLPSSFRTFAPNFDVSPIVNRDDRNLSNDIAPIHPTGEFGADDGNSTLKEFLRVPPVAINDNSNSDMMGVQGAPTIQVSSPPGPHWSPGIRGSADNSMCTPLSSPLLPSGEKTIRIEQTLNFLDASPVSDHSHSEESVMDQEAQVFQKFIMGAPPSPVKHLTHRRTPFVPTETVGKPVALDAGVTVSNRSHMLELEMSNHNRSRSTVYGRLRRPPPPPTLSSADKEYVEALNGRRRLLGQIERNRANFEKIKRRAAEEEHLKPPMPVGFGGRNVSLISSRIMPRSAAALPSAFLKSARQVPPIIPTSSQLNRSSFLYPRRAPQLEISTVERIFTSTNSSRRSPSIGTASRRNTSVERPPWR